MKKNLSTIILILVFLTGLSLLLYPSVSDYWNSFHQSRAIATYASDVAALDDQTYEKLWEDAQAYNKRLLQREEPLRQTEKRMEEYERLLNVDATGVMGYIEIPELKVSLPVYHGVDEGVLQIAVGHIPGSSLPVGGKGTHCVLSGHRGLPSAKLFTNLDELREGDRFMLRVLDETLTYEVDQILIVEPQEVDDIAIDPEQDYCTLVTCTPYGINTHRLLVRGHRVENQADAQTIRVTADAMQVEPVIVAPIVAPMLLGLMLWVLLRNPKKKRKNTH